MSGLKFESINYEKYNTKSINIDGGLFKLQDNYEILKNEETQWNNRKAVIKLKQHDLCELIKLWETEVNYYLNSKGIEPVTILYGDKIYPKTYLLPNMEINYIILKSIWVNGQNKPFIQLWLE